MKKIKYAVFFVLSVMSFGVQACYESLIESPNPFMGNHGEIFKLANGQIGEVLYEYEYLYEYYPQVVVCEAQGKLLVAGKSLDMKLINKTSQRRSSEMFEVTIDGEFNGWNGETLIKLTNGQIWQQTDYFYFYRYAFMPKAIIYKDGSRYKMKIEGVDKSVGVERLK
ncbi:hypothetical protein JHL22_15340 [Advenella sp. WQ 585]|uniref:Lipoprotein n=1 Tax=Advenella mandrilli TaxID=2800330 RepID=A0ABS1EHY5_9BURK|nr:hypothetical protein [Advenella mandrilli]MBK1782586.1 hypothetical protein [Advenella mandrilli]